MAKTRRFFISDIHLTSKERYEDCRYPSWYKPKEHDPRLLGFIDKNILKDPDSVKDVILLGDVFNTWMCPADTVPPTYKEIFAANQGVINKFGEITKKGINLFYVNGNHDSDLKPAEIKSVIPGIQVIRYYLSGRIRAEHGHEYDFFNRADYLTDPGFGRPIGYFISRLVASANGDEFATLDMAGYLDDLIEAAITPQNVYSSIIEGLAERANLNEDSEIKMPDDRSLKICELKTRYAVLGEVYTIRDLLGNLYERRHLDGTADRLCKKYDLDVVVFGHTHNAKLDKDFFLVQDRIYANTGSWCKKNAYCVEIDKDPDPANPIHVYLRRVCDTGEIANTVEESI